MICLTDGPSSQKEPTHLSSGGGADFRIIKKLLCFLYYVLPNMQWYKFDRSYLSHSQFQYSCRRSGKGKGPDTLIFRTYSSRILIFGIDLITSMPSMGSPFYDLSAVKM